MSESAKVVLQEVLYINSRKSLLKDENLSEDDLRASLGDCLIVISSGNSYISLSHEE